MNGYNLFEEESIAVIEKYKELALKNEDGIPCIFGSLVLTNDDGDVEDIYQIEIKAVADYPIVFQKFLKQVIVFQEMWIGIFLKIKVIVVLHLHQKKSSFVTLE